MREIGRTTKLQEEESTSISMGPDTKVDGLTITSMERELRPGLMAVNMKDFTKRGKRTDRANTHGKTVVTTRENGEITRLTVMELMFGLTVDNIRANGSTTRCMEEVTTSGKMVVVRMVTICMTRSMVLELILGLMGENTLDSGLTANVMDMVR